MSQQDLRRQPWHLPGSFENSRVTLVSVDTERASETLTLEGSPHRRACSCTKYLYKPEREHDQPLIIRVAKSEGSAHEPDKSGGANAVTPWGRSLWAG